MSVDFSCAASRKEREMYENNLNLGVNGQGRKFGPIKNRADFPLAAKQLIALK